MKNIFAIIIVILLFTSCSNSEKIKKIENRIINLENQNKNLLDSLNSVNTKFIKPFKIYEKIVLSELKNSPNQIISDYKFLIRDYPNSFWKHEAEKRIKNIEKRKKYWSKKNSWELPGQPKKPEIIETVSVISCPGC